MIKKFWKKITASLLTLMMTLSMITVMPVSAADYLEFDTNSKYTIVSKDNKAFTITGIGWENHAKISEKVSGTSVGSNNVFFKMTPTADQLGLAANQVKVQIEYFDTDGTLYPIRTEENNNYTFADKDKRYDSVKEIYIITKTDDDKGIIQAVSNSKYITNDNGEVRFATFNSSEAEEFTFIKDATVKDFSLYIEHKATGKYIKADGVNGNPLTVDGIAGQDGVIGDDLRFNLINEGNQQDDRNVLNFQSKAYPTLAWKTGSKDELWQNNAIKAGGWESVVVVANGDGTVSFRSSENGQYYTVKNNNIVRVDGLTKLTDNEKFIIHSVTSADAVDGVKVSDVNDTSLTVSWNALDKDVQNGITSLYSGYKVVATPNVTSGSPITSDETLDTSLTLTGLSAGVNYEIKVLTVNADSPSGESEAISAQTKDGPRPVQAINLHAVGDEKEIKVSWDAVDGATSYDIYRAASAFATYEPIGTSTTTEFVVSADKLNKGKYNNYFKVVAKNKNGDSALSDEYTSLETELFGKNMIFFAGTDDRTKIDEVVQEIFKRQNDTSADAQFNENRYAIYYKPGDYTDTQCLPVGFYTHVGGLGKTPYDVKLNNIEVPAYLDGNATSGNHWGNDGVWRNATCNFWRSAENLSVVGTGEASVADQLSASTDNNKKDYFNWSVAQAAPLRRVYSTRNVSYDWASGWASGGYTADCYFTNDANTSSGQQYFTRNTVVNGNATGTTLNNFNMGVVSNSLPSSTSGKPLTNNNGYTNWDAGKVDTSITVTPKVREKPFLFLDDDGEYKIFKPALAEDTSGISWSEDTMGRDGYKILKLDEFYIAHEGDTAATINEQLANGKNIFFTPGVYHAEEAIHVTKADTVVLGTGMASIIPDNKEAAMVVDDVDGVIVAGLIFDAGTKISKYLLKVGDDDADKSHAENPTQLQDLFFRVGGTTDKLTSADDALVINSNDVICDHFWIWRADHGTGVGWKGNVSKHGLIVNGDNVTCYALFNEHFQEYDTLWNGENGATYFYQNEKCYDPMNQESWMSHDGLVNGYAAYKVSNNVKKHYAVGLGIYNVFIYAGHEDGTALGDSTNVQIQLDNAIEVPNTDNTEDESIIIENACIQTFAKADGALQKFNHIVNGIGDGVASGIDQVTGEQGSGWADPRPSILSINNGEVKYGYTPNVKTEKGTNPYNEEGDIDLTKLRIAYGTYKTEIDKEEIYTPETFGPYKEAVNQASEVFVVLDDETGKLKPNNLTQGEANALADLIQKTYNGLDVAKANYSELELVIAEANALRKTTDYTSQFYTIPTRMAFDVAYNTAKGLITDKEDGNVLDATDQKTVDDAKDALKKAMEELEIKKADYEPLKKAMDRAKAIKEGANYKSDKYVPSTKELFDYYYDLGEEIYNTSLDEDTYLDARSQALIEARAANIHNGIDQLLLLPAKTSSLEELIKFAEDNIRDGEYFENEYYKNVAQFLDYLQKARVVIKDANINDQEVIDQTWDDLYNAIINLELKDADYTELNKLREEAKQIVSGTNYKQSRYTDSTVAYFDLVNGQATEFSNDYLIPDQELVDQQAKELRAAIDQLKLKEEVDEDEVEDPADVGEEVSGETEPTEPEIEDTDETEKPDETENSDGTKDPEETKVPEETTDSKTDINETASETSSSTGSEKSNKKGVKTGDDTAIAGFGILAMASAGIYFVVRRKKDEN